MVTMIRKNLTYYDFCQRSGFKPYDYQERVANILLSGKNVILSVPTGAGKTWASIMPFLYARKNPHVHFPRKLIYSLPLRALTNSIYEDLKQVTDSSIQTGEYSEDKYFEKDIILSTIDQTLSNFLCFPLSLSHRQANINAGALVGSYLVFDEFHLLDSNLSMATTLGMLKMLGHLSRCCIMTATLTVGFMNELKRSLNNNYEIITLNNFPEDKMLIGSLRPIKGKKQIRTVDQPISVEKIIQEHKNKTIVICNRVETTQKLLNELNSKRKELNETEIICLHSRFFDKDRKTKEKKIKDLFGKTGDKSKKAILISTQVIEAGMDISCDVMHTEISPINSFLQRAGRLARFGDEIGTLFVYTLLEVEEREKIQMTPENDEDKEEIKRLNNKYLPYEKDICENTFAALKQYETLDGDIPNRLIETILEEKETELASQLRVADFNRKEILDSWEACQKHYYRSTIRDIQNVEVTIINDTQLDEVSKFPFRYQSLSVFKWSLVAWLNTIAKKDSAGPPAMQLEKDDWLVKFLDEPSDLFLENDESIKYALKTIYVEGFKTIPAHVFLNAKYFGYSPDLGFNCQYPSTFNFTSPITEPRDKPDENTVYRKDTFYQHNKALIGVFEDEFMGKEKDRLDFVFKELANFIGSSIGKEEFVKLITLMLLLHDYGKLNIEWQLPMQRYQALKDSVDLTTFEDVLAHTDYDLNNGLDEQFARKAKLHSRPPHAAVGAVVAQEQLPNICANEYIIKGISTAIARHHSPSMTRFPSFNVSAKNYLEMQKLFIEFGFDISLNQKGSDGRLNDLESTKEQIIYFFFARILRLCDQKATKDFRKFFKERNYV